jgi:hypothetical protein
MKNTVIVGIFAILTLVHIVPALAALAPSRLSALYGFKADDRVLITLLQHRAVLLGLVAGGFAAAIFIPHLRGPALIFGAISMVSFIFVAAQQGTLEGPLSKIVIADAVAIPLAAIAAYFVFLSK